VWDWPGVVYINFIQNDKPAAPEVTLRGGNLANLSLNCEYLSVRQVLAGSSSVAAGYNRFLDLRNPWMSYDCQSEVPKYY